MRSSTSNPEWSLLVRPHLIDGHCPRALIHNSFPPKSRKIVHKVEILGWPLQNFAFIGVSAARLVWGPVFSDWEGERWAAEGEGEGVCERCIGAWGKVVWGDSD